MVDRKLARGASLLGKKKASFRARTNLKAEEVKGGTIMHEGINPRKVHKGMTLEIVKTEDGRGQVRLRSDMDQDVHDMDFSMYCEDIDRVEEPSTLKMKGVKISSSWTFKGLTGKVFLVEGKDPEGRFVRAAFLVHDPQGWISAIGHPEWKMNKSQCGMKSAFAL